MRPQAKLFPSLNSRGDANPAWRYGIGGSALHLAAGFGHVRVAEVLLDRGWDIEAKSDYGWRPLHYAAVEGHLQMIQLLLRRGAMVDCQSNHNTTPLHLAARERHAKAVSLLLSLGADRTIKIKFGIQPRTLPRAPRALPDQQQPQQL